MANTKIAIGCIIQWYEVEVHREYIQSVVNAINFHDKNDVIVDLCIYLSQNIEKLDPEQISMDEIIEKFKSSEQILKDNGILYNLKWHTDENIYTISDYRREFNENYCNIVDVLMWGESDALIPKQSFLILSQLHQKVKEKSPKYISFFGMCKMWDYTWEMLEHPEFTNKEYASGPENIDKWWGTWYTMNIEEMDEINSKTEDLEINPSLNHKTNGCGLVISSEIVRAGVNIPKSALLVHEDTSFMHILRNHSSDIVQYTIKNILLVHNRKHPKKRMYVLNEDIHQNPTDKRESSKWYPKVWILDQIHSVSFNKQWRTYNWNDVNNMTLEECQEEISKFLSAFPNVREEFNN
tara:strand:- start:281 stop:1336 length:1056 start_codon:yes stop_codon:yes gene_type:complete